MTTRQRRERKVERLRAWAKKREEHAATVLAAHEAYTSDHAFNTQPGHIPLRARIIAQEKREFVSMDKAADFRARASMVEAQAEHAIYSDDEDAIERLEARITVLEAERARMKAVNAYIRKRGVENVTFSGLKAAFGLSDEDISCLREAIGFAGSPGYPAYALSNLAGNIGRQRKRLAALKSKREANDRR